MHAVVVRGVNAPLRGVSRSNAKKRHEEWVDRVTRCFRLFQRRAVKGSWAGDYPYDDRTPQLAVASAKVLISGTSLGMRRRYRPLADKLHSCTYPGCDKTFCHATHARRHERKFHHFWRSRYRQLEHRANRRTSVSVDPSISVSVIDSADYGVCVADSASVDGELNRTASSEDRHCIESCHNNHE